MAKVEKARVFMSGRSQAVRIPAEYRFRSSEVYIRRDPQSGAITLSEQPQKRSLEEVFAMLDAAGGADELLRDRDTEKAEEREWM
jgi:antitoxin VapB